MTPAAQNRFIMRKRLAISFVVVSLVIILLGLLSYFWLPGFAKSKVEEVLSETLDRPVTIESIDIHLYSLELTVHGFRVGEKTTHEDANEKLFAFKKLYVDLSIDSIAKRAPVISAITLESPMLRLVRTGKNHFNITDLVEKFTRPEADDDASEAAKPHFSVSNIILSDGRFELVDRFKQSHQEITQMHLGVPFVANFESAQETWVKPHFSAKVNGAPFSLAGKLRPFTSKREVSLAIKLKGIDLTHTDEYSPIPVGISLLSGYFDSDLQLTFTQLADESPSIQLSGQAILRQVAVKNRAVEAPYKAGLEQLTIRLNKFDLLGQKPSHVALALNNLALTREHETAPALSLSKLVADDILVDMAQQQIVLDELSLDRLHASIRREADGRIDLTQLFASLPGNNERPDKEQVRPEPTITETAIPIPGRKPEQQLVAAVSIPIPAQKPPVAASIQIDAKEKKTIANATSAADSAEQASSNKQAWMPQINHLKLIAASLRFEDATLTKAAPMVINPLNLTLDNIDLSGASPLDLELRAKVNKIGSIDTKGSLAWAPLATDLDLDLQEMDLVSLQGWAGDQFDALLTEGAVSFKGKVTASGEPLKIAVNGQGQLSNFNIFSKVTASDLLRWETLDINELKFVNEPLSVDINSIKLDNFFARVMILPKGDLNLGKIVRQDKEAASATPPNSPNTTQSSDNQALPIDIGKIILQQGNVKFSDQFIKPNYRANLTGLSGQIGPLHPGESGEIEIRGAVDKSAPLEIRGKVDPFSRELQLDLIAKVKGIDLPPFSPYSGKYVGYEIKKGKLSVDVEYQIEEGVLKAKNNIFLDQFTLGKEIDNPDAPSLPIGLAVSLLKNRQGEIEIHLPIKGSINDPQFSLGDIIFDAFVNLIMKAVTAPFALLGSVLEGGEELSKIDFKPGFAEIEVEAEENLQTLSKVLVDRPALELEITGYADPVNELEGLKRAILERKVKAQKLSESAKEGKAGGSLDEIKLDPDEYEKFLKLAYKEEEFEKPTNILGLTKSIPVSEMEQLMLAHIEISDDDLQSLAKQRANAARDWLVNQGEISNDRIFILGAKTETDNETPGSRAEFSLK